MTSFCGFCGAKALDDRAQFCSDCGGKLEQSVEGASTAKSTLPLMAMDPNQPGVILSPSFVDLLKHEAAGGKESAPEGSVELSKSFLSIISDTTEEPLLSRDTLRELPPMQAADIPSKEPIVTLPDFLAPMQHISALEPLTLPVETKPRAPALKLQKILTPDPSLDLSRDTLPETRAAKSALAEKTEDEPSVLLSTSLEEIILNETQRTEAAKLEPKTEPKTEPKEERPRAPVALAEVFAVSPKLPFPKLEAPPKSVLLAEPASVVSEGFTERLAKASWSSLLSTAEVQRAARSRWVQALLVMLAGPLLAKILQDTLWDGFARLQPLGLSLALCLLLFRLLAEERQPLWRSLTVLPLSFTLGVFALRLFAPTLRVDTLLFVGVFSLLATLVISASLGVVWWLGPRLRILAQPMDGLLLGTFCGAGCAAGVGSALEISGGFLIEILFAEVLCGGLAGYFWGLVWYKAGARRTMIIAATLGVSLLHSVLCMLSAEASREGGAAIGRLLFTLLLLCGYLVLFGYAIKLKQLERN